MVRARCSVGGYSLYNYAYNNPVKFTDPDGRKPMAPDQEQAQWMFPMSLWSFYANGGGNGAELQEFIAQNNGLGAFQDLLTGTMGKKGGGGGSNNGPAKNIIINFIRGDKKGLGNFVNNDFAVNGWHIIDALNLKDALTQLSKYLGKNKADNIYINAHGLVSQRYVLDGDGQLITDANSDTGYRMTGDNGFYTDIDTEKILGSDIQMYVSDKNKLSSDKASSIDSFIGIANYVEKGKNLIMGSCWSARYDNLFGSGISSIVKSIDVFVNRDYSSSWPIGGKIRFQDFTGYNQTSQSNYIDGWIRYRDGSAVQQNFNIIMTKYGVKTIK